jgi:hypothetical protein
MENMKENYNGKRTEENEKYDNDVREQEAGIEGEKKN